MKFTISTRVYIEDTDLAGIVYYVNYLKFFERARTELMRTLGFDKKFYFQTNSFFVVHSLSIKYLLPATLDDELEVTADISHLGRASIYFNQSIFRNKEKICFAEVKVACVNKDSKKPKAIPSTIIKAFSHPSVR